MPPREAGAKAGHHVRGRLLEDDFEFYTRRADEERRAAQTATHPEAQISHRKLSEEYAARASAIAGGEKAGTVEPAGNVPPVREA